MFVLESHRLWWDLFRKAIGSGQVFFGKAIGNGRDCLESHRLWSGLFRKGHWPRSGLFGEPQAVAGSMRRNPRSILASCQQWSDLLARAIGNGWVYLREP